MESDNTLMARCGARDEAAFNELYYRYAARVIVFLRQLVDRERANDVAQTTWQNVWARSHTYDPARGEGRFRPWLFQIARCAAIDLLRKTGRELSGWEGAEDDPSPLESAEARDPPPEEALATREDVDALRECIAALPAKLRAVCTLFYLEGLTINEVAAALGLPKGTVQGDTARVRERLVRGLARKGIVLPGCSCHAQKPES
jgi:RNA polymerase sigma-70 factor (ECF subfamily)